ncbi:hypothetical protein MDOR_28040 [Mycolicibacterium doricum]|uniref:DUF4190 domain-containing protein n=1 Tax=Mycolicibacterium doricum TaxID=126673 RepID=A0A1X1TF51_9MYCO|nr:DUF4190 domain-containing protein [Mycolicibacterium doricum]MCV7268422.1 DUF4190 domain-containing protein [Mycolicibacterium doricum]ORV43166.1 hypothetical protein AWC01_06595 [Mycolicibacterium doricum]BBZ08635.1 hypothetical protein MDOR_28040 [Mycolicibacterium doricum]
MTNPDRDPEPSSGADPGASGSEPHAGGYETPAYGEQPGYQQPGYQQPGYPPPPPGYQSYGSYGTPYDTPAGYPPPPPGYAPYATSAGYPQPPPNYVAFGPPGQGTNGLAVGSLVASIMSVPFFLFCFIGIIPALVGIALGIIALSQTKNSNEQGKGLAVAGIAVGAVTLLAGLVMAVVVMNS